jgi:hypothetical protein
MAGETYDTELFERVVREVIRRLTQQGHTTIQVAAAGGELVLSERVVSMATLSGRLENVRQVIVPQRAIVTPAVRDELKQRSIELLRR